MHCCLIWKLHHTGSIRHVVLCFQAMGPGYAQVLRPWPIPIPMSTRGRDPSWVPHTHAIPYALQPVNNTKMKAGTKLPAFILVLLTGCGAASPSSRCVSFQCFLACESFLCTTETSLLLSLPSVSHQQNYRHLKMYLNWLIYFGFAIKSLREVREQVNFIKTSK